MTASTKYPLIIRVLHWLMALVLIGMLILGNVMEGLSRDDAWRPFFYDIHKATGVTLLGFALLRLALRFSFKLPAEPSAISRSERILALCAHYGAYGLMVAIPCTGILMTNAFGFTVHWFGGVALPKITGVNMTLGKQARDMHELLADILIGFIALHVCAVIKHYVRENINLLKRML